MAFVAMPIGHKTDFMKTAITDNRNTTVLIVDMQYNCVNMSRKLFAQVLMPIFVALEQHCKLVFYSDRLLKQLALYNYTCPTHYFDSVTDNFVYSYSQILRHIHQMHIVDTLTCC